VNTRGIGAGTCVVAAAIVTAAWLAMPRAAAGQAAATVAGRWTFTFSPPARAGARARGAARGARRGQAGRSGPGPAARGRAGGAPADRVALLALSRGPADTVTGTIDLNPGARTAPGNNPDRPVEISDGRLDGGHLTFSTWYLDGYRNRIHFDGTVEGDLLHLTLHRTTPSGVETTQVTARRAR
jgi:hypothetical protein